MRTVVASLALIGSAVAQSAAAGTPPCYPLNQIEQALGGQYGERQRFAGRDADGADAVEYRLYVNAETGSWSWVGIPEGTRIGCLVFSGRSEAALLQARPPKGRVPHEAQF